MEQDRGEERSLLAIGAGYREVFQVSVDDRGRALQPFDALPDFCHLIPARQWSHSHAFDRGIAEGGSREPFAERLDDGLDQRFGYDDAADRRATLARLKGHLARDFLDEEVELFRARRRIGTKEAEIERVRFHVEADRLLDDARMSLELSPSGS